MDQYDYEYDEDQLIPLQTATQGNNGGINIVILGDGYDAYSIINGNYLAHMKLAMENFFDVEPYKTYRNYFNVYTSISLSQEAGVGSVNGIRNNKFGTTYTGDACLEANYNALFASALKAPTVNEGNLKETLIIVVPNCVDYGGCTHLWTDGSAISFCPMNVYEYPSNTRGVVHHEAGGHGFGKLGDENISYNAFIDNVHTIMFNSYKVIGWYDNLSLTGKVRSSVEALYLRFTLQHCCRYFRRRILLHSWCIPFGTKLLHEQQHPVLQCHQPRKHCETYQTVCRRKIFF